MKKIVIITGLTGSGKSDLALKIAREFNGEIISADSVQIYRDLNIGSAKESAENMAQIKHHLINIKNFDESYNVGEFVADCKKAIEVIEKRGKLPIIVGGTGLYVKALLQGYTLGGTQANLQFRKNYEQLAKENGNEFVWNILNNINSEKAKTVHFNNLKRVIRYLEIEMNNEKMDKTESILKGYDVLAIGIVADRELIYNKIDKRVDKMLEMGLEKEVENLIANGANRSCQSMNSIGYKEWLDFYEGKIDKLKTIELIKQHTRNYCKRQLTFLKTIPNLKMLTIPNAEITIKEFLS